MASIAEKHTAVLAVGNQTGAADVMHRLRKLQASVSWRGEIVTLRHANRCAIQQLPTMTYRSSQAHRCADCAGMHRDEGVFDTASNRP